MYWLHSTQFCYFCHSFNVLNPCYCVAILICPGFASDQFNFGDGRDHLGNRVVLIGSTRTYEGEVHKDGSLETQIMFYTPP